MKRKRRRHAWELHVQQVMEQQSNSGRRGYQAVGQKWCLELKLKANN